MSRLVASASWRSLDLYHNSPASTRSHNLTSHHGSSTPSYCKNLPFADGSSPATTVSMPEMLSNGVSGAWRSRFKRVQSGV